MELTATEVVKTDNGDGTYRISLEPRGTVVLEESKFQRLKFAVMEWLVKLIFPKITPHP